MKLTLTLLLGMSALAVAGEYHVTRTEFDFTIRPHLVFCTEHHGVPAIATTELRIAINEASILDPELKLEESEVSLVDTRARPCAEYADILKGPALLTGKGMRKKTFRYAKVTGGECRAVGFQELELDLKGHKFTAWHEYKYRLFEEFCREDD